MTFQPITLLVLALLALPATAADRETTPAEPAPASAGRVESPRERMLQMHRQHAREGHGTHYGMGWERRQGMGPMMMERGERRGPPAPEQPKSE